MSVQVQNVRLSEDAVARAWAGAVIDTDGWIGLSGSPLKYARAIVTNQNLEIISALLRHFGGGARFAQPGVKGPIWEWYRGGEGPAMAFIEAISPYSTKAQAFLGGN
jgi:hypothetical protein